MEKFLLNKLSKNELSKVESLKSGSLVMYIIGKVKRSVCLIKLAPCGTQLECQDLQARGSSNLKINLIDIYEVRSGCQTDQF